MIFFSHNRAKGFTLIELLVVIAIIGVLSSIVLASLNTARVKARDAKRKADFRSIQSALALYYDAYGFYPPAKPRGPNCGGTPDVWASSNGTCGGQWLTTDNNFYQFMPNVPVDPVNQGIHAGWIDTQYVYSYYHQSAANSQDYMLITQLENQSDPARCATRAAYYHGVIPSVPWCGPWPTTLSPPRNGSIYSDH